MKRNKKWKEQVYYQINVTQLIEPEVVDGRGDCWEVVLLESVSTEGHGSTEAGQNPPIGHALTAAQLRHTDQHAEQGDGVNKRKSSL